MRKMANRPMTVGGLAIVALIAAGCGNDGGADASLSPQVGLIATSEAPAQPAQVQLVGDRDVEVTLTGPIAAKYLSATQNQKDFLGKPLTGDRNAGARESGAVFQQFEGGVIIAANAEAATPGYITWGKIREAWNVQRDAAGMPEITGENGSVGPLGVPTSDETADGDLLVTTFQHGKIAYNSKTGQVEVTVNDKVVPAGL